MPVDYKQSKIYKIVNDLPELQGKIYVGSTCRTLAQRMGEHRNNCRRGKSSALHQAMRQHGVQNFYIILIEPYPCNNKDELRAREHYHITQLNAISNGFNQRCSVLDEQKRKETMQRCTIQLRQHNKATGRYRCDTCNYNAIIRGHLNKHFSTQRHQAREVEQAQQQAQLAIGE